MSLLNEVGKPLRSLEVVVIPRIENAMLLSSESTRNVTRRLKGGKCLGILHTLNGVSLDQKP
jgi:hypothetical protein